MFKNLTTLLMVFLFWGSMTYALFGQSYLGLRVNGKMGNELVSLNQNRTFVTCPSGFDHGAEMGGFFKGVIWKDISGMIDLNLNYQSMFVCNRVGQGGAQRNSDFDVWTYGVNGGISLNYWPEKEGARFIAGVGLQLHSTILAHGNYYWSQLEDSQVTFVRDTGVVTDQFNFLTYNPMVRLGLSINQPSGNQLFFALNSTYSINPIWEDPHSRYNNLWFGIEVGYAWKRSGKK